MTLIRMARRVLTFLLSLLMLLPALARAESPKREFRGAWVATIYGLDWPSAPATTAADVRKQQTELSALLDRMASSGVNAVMFQVRTFADALYKSKYEPWASVLTGRRGQAPAVDWDPLQFCIDEAHARGMECHAWVNPFRYSSSTRPYSDPFDAKVRPLLISFTEQPKSGKEKPKTTVILDPGNPLARRHVVQVCRDIVSRYDIDGLVFDDYFYPDRLPLGSGYDFDEWKKSGSPLSQADWRRHNVNTVIASVYDMIQEVKPHVVFGVSPAGVAGGNGESSARYSLPRSPGNDWMYGRLFCDPLEWMHAGKVDYISPQIYWNNDHKTNPYTPIARWWGLAADRLGCRVYPSISLSSFANAGGNTQQAWQERDRQISANREVASFDAPGSILYAARNINEFGRHLAGGLFSRKALPPAFPDKQTTDPGAVTRLTLKGNTLSWDAPAEGLRYSVYAVPDEVDLIDAISVSDGGLSADYLVGITYRPSFTLPAGLTRHHRIAVAPLDRYGHEWEVEFLK
ncbi:MAG: family 10 glycosylhydrolase [Muribaculaceae bacterium]|nr:family 10 glycosylhydrolase [Muribaculaceae bacterium]